MFTPQRSNLSLVLFYGFKSTQIERWGVNLHQKNRASRKRTITIIMGIVLVVNAKAWSGDMEVAPSQCVNKSGRAPETETPHGLVRYSGFVARGSRSRWPKKKNAVASTHTTEHERNGGRGE
jgi:hypothetical protein